MLLLEQKLKCFECYVFGLGTRISAKPPQSAKQGTIIRELYLTPQELAQRHMKASNNSIRKYLAYGGFGK